MKKKTPVLFLILLSFPGMLSARFVLKKELNAPRPGDEIIKQQVEYKDPGRSGESVLWDFSRLQAVNPEYKVSYHAPELSGENTYIMRLDTFSADKTNPEELLIGYEHFTAYYYQLTDNRLFLLGHANAVSQMRHEKPIPIMEYPFTHGKTLYGTYHSQTFYAGAKPMNCQGDIHIKSDAYGMMIMPDKDTLHHVMRIKTVRTIIEIPDTNVNRRQSGNKRTEHLHLPMNTRIENCLWYAEGYRYPIFETIRHFNENDSISREFFSTAFYYPPQEHYYLETDTANKAIVEKNTDKKDNPLEGTTFNAFPNPVNTILNVEIFLPVEAKIKIQIRSVANKNVYVNENRGKFSSGTHSFQLNVSNQPQGFYLLNIWADNYLLSETLLKQ